MFRSDELRGGILAGRTCWETATTITLTSGSTLSGIDFTLDQGGEISGYVYGPDNIPLENINVLLDEGDFRRGTCTDETGHFIFNNVALNADSAYSRG